MEMYLGMRKLTSQPHLFQSVNDTSKKLSTPTPNHIVKRLVALIQRDPKDYGSHSLRSGATTEAIQRGVSKDDVRKQGGWSVNSATIEKYIRDDEQARVRTAKTS
jgi:integrase